ncbi:uncharacterized protein O3C94_019091 [Discoglossus pictus]
MQLQLCVVSKDKKELTSKNQSVQSIGCLSHLNRKYYVEVQRKEVGFDLSGTQTDKIRNYRLYQIHGVHLTQRLKRHFLDHQMEASLRSYVGKLDKTVKINQERKKQVQKKIKRKMSLLAIPDRMNSSNVCLRRARVKYRFPKDLEDISSDLPQISPPEISNKEFQRLVSSAAKLIVATTPKKHDQQTPSSACCPSWSCDDTRLTSQVVQSQQSQSLKIPSSIQESYSSFEVISEEDANQMEENDPGAKTNETEQNNPGIKTQMGSEITEIKEQDTTYEIRVYTGSSTEVNPKQALVITLIGSNGKSNRIFLEKSSTNAVPFCTGQMDIFKTKAKDVGKLEELVIAMNRKSTNSRCYIEDIIVKTWHTTAELYVFPCNRWLSFSETIVPVLPHTPEQESAGKTPQVQPQDENHIKAKKENLQPLHTESKQRRASTTSNTNHSGKIFTKTSQEKEADVKKDKRAQNDGESAQVESLDCCNGAATGEPSLYENNNPDSVTNSATQPENNIDNVTNSANHTENKITDNVIDKPPAIQNKPRKASSPAGYVFFSHDIKTSPSIIGSRGQSSRSNISSSKKQHKKELKLVTPSGVDEIALGSSAGAKDKSINISQLVILQQILSEPPAGPESQGNCISLENSRVTNSGASLKEDGSQDVNTQQTCTIGITDSCSQLADQISGCCCSCDRDQDSYVSDSTLDDDFLFSDTSLALSLSENEDSEDDAPPSDSDSGEPGIRIRNLRRFCKDLRTNPTQDISYLFARGLEAIEKTDRAELMRLSQGHFFLFRVSVRNLSQGHFFLLSSADKDGKTLLHHAASRGNVDICQVLLDTNVGMINIDKQDVFGKTALHYAIQKSHSKMVKLLIKNGAKSEFKDKNPKTAVDVALGQIPEI